MEDESNVEYAGFWLRVLASVIDSILYGVIVIPILMNIYGDDYFTSERLILGSWDLLLSWLLPAVAVVAFWVYRSATPGKMLVRIRVVDARTGDKPGVGQSVLRYLGYFVSTIPLLLGILWVAFDQRKQGWHDKLAGTLVIRDPIVGQASGAQRPQ